MIGTIHYMLRKVNISKTKDPRYRFPWHVRWRTDDGRQPKRSFQTQKQAENFAQMVFSNINSEFFQSIIPLDWKDLIEEFIAAKSVNRLAPETQAMYRRIHKHFGEVNGSPICSKVNIRHIDVYKNSIRENAAPTINKKLRHLSAMFNWAVKRNYMVANPIESTDKIRERKKIRKVWTPQQFMKVMAACDDIQWRVLAYLAINGVGRKAALAKLKRKDIDLKVGIITVIDKNQQEKQTPLHPHSLKILCEYILQLPLNQNNIFTCKFNHATWKRYCKIANVPFVTFHHLRTCMSNWLKNRGVSGDVVTAIFGHSDPKLTYDYYTQLDDLDSKRRAINLLPLGTDLANDETG